MGFNEVEQSSRRLRRSLVICSHRHENDPASARGDVPTNSINNTNHYNSSSNNSPARVPPFATASLHKRHGTNNTKRDGHINRSSHAADCGRDDEVVREHEVTVNHHGPDEDRFALALKKQGLEIVEQEGDGNCLFRAISLQVYGDASMHGEVRNRCLDFMVRRRKELSIWWRSILNRLNWGGLQVIILSFTCWCRHVIRSIFLSSSQMNPLNSTFNGNATRESTGTTQRFKPLVSSSTDQLRYLYQRMGHTR